MTKKVSYTKLFLFISIYMLMSFILFYLICFIIFRDILWIKIFLLILYPIGLFLYTKNKKYTFELTKKGIGLFMGDMLVKQIYFSQITKVIIKRTIKNITAIDYLFVYYGFGNRSYIKINLTEKHDSKKFILDLEKLSGIQIEK